MPTSSGVPTSIPKFASTAYNLTILAGLGLPVRRILATDLSKARYPFAYMILARIPGRDLRYELPGMTQPQMTRLAGQIVEFQQRVATLPPGQAYGYVPIGAPGQFADWLDKIVQEIQELTTWATTAAHPPIITIAQRLAAQVERYTPYLQAVPSTVFWMMSPPKM